MNHAVRILVVDDDPEVLNGTAHLLEKAGYAVDRASSGPESFQAIRNHCPDLVLLDRDMPDMDGIEVCRRIKLDPDLVDSMVVIASGSYTESEEQSEGLDSGADGYIVRPIANRELLARVRAFIRIRHLTHSLREQTIQLQERNEMLRKERLASLNLMEDAVDGRARAEKACQALRESEESLIQARDEAEKANRAKSQFLATMSHELRTPLNPILGFTDLLSTAPNLTDEQKLWLRIVNQRGQDLLGLIQSVLDLSKIEAGKLVVERAPLELRQMVRDLVTSITPAADKKGLRLEWNVAPDVADNVLADGFRLRQVLLNLLNNALKFTDQGSIEVRVLEGRASCLAREPAGDEIPLLFSIKDTGLGVPADRQTAIFEAFEHADHAHAVRYGGAGLGLSIARRLVELMGGQIWVESPSAGSISLATGQSGSGDKGPGSTFFFTILAGVSTEAIPPPDGADVVSESGMKHPLRVLVVDDDMTSRFLAEVLLRKAGHFVLTADDGRQAVTRMEAETFDVVLMDIRMPGIDGLEATRLIREHENKSGRHTTIIALTAHAMAGDKGRFLEAGMDGYLAKPIHRADLLAVIHKTIASRSA